jgi:hypothetical protein
MNDRNRRQVAAMAIEDGEKRHESHAHPVTTHFTQSTASWLTHFCQPVNTFKLLHARMRNPQISFG